MSIRTWEAAQSAQIEIDGELYPVVTQEDLIKAVLDGAIMVDRAGGCLAVGVTRLPTAIPNEMVTTRALCTWMDRTNAKPQAEPNALKVDPLEDVAVAPPEGVILDPEPTEPDARLEGRDGSDPIGDGLVVDPEAVDESDPDLQAAVRG